MVAGQSHRDSEKDTKTYITHKQNGIGIGPVLMLAVLLLAAARSDAQTLPYPYVPLFQSAVFYNMDLDVSPGFTMIFTGPVVCNGNIWCYPAGGIEFEGPVEAAENYFFHWDTNGDQSANISSSPITPIFNAGLPISGIAPLTVPVAGLTNFEAVLNLPPPELRAPQEIAYNETNQIFLFNEVDLIVSNAAYGIDGAAPWTNPFTVYLQDRSPILSPPLLQRWTQLTNDIYIISNCYPSHTLWTTNWVPNFQFTNDVRTIMWTNTTAGSNGPGPVGTNCVWYAGFSFLTNVFYYDYRESRTNEIVQLDVGKLGAWITNATPNAGSNWNQALSANMLSGIDSIFIYNDTPFTSALLPGISVIDGALLPSSTTIVQGESVFTSGLTVVTPQPLYVIGNYNVETNGGTPVEDSHNVVATYPAALMADAITVLSTNWPMDWKSDAYSSRPAASTTINAACLTGIVPSTGGQTDAGDGPGAHYSGGLENYFRLLENWSEYTLTFNGSMAAMFPSVYATNYWQLPGNYYGPPVRNWEFDTNFLTEAGLPPLTPILINSNAAPTLLNQPANAVVLAGQTTNFNVTASGVPAVGYQWFLAGKTNLFGATNASLALTNIQLADAGNYYVVVTNVLGSIISSNALLSVYASAAPVLNAFTFSQSGGAQFTVSGVPGFNYTVETSTNLIDWILLMSGNSPFIFTDTNAALSQRFYRGVYLP